MRIRPAVAVLVAALLAGLPALSAPGTQGVQWLPAVEIASGGGTKGPWRQNGSDYDYVDDGTPAFLPDGRLAVAWVDQRRKEVLLQVLGTDGRPVGAPADVSRSPATFSWLPRVVSAGPDTLHVLWQEIIFSGGSHGGDILFAYSLDGGRSFSAPRNLSASRGGDGKGRLDRDTWSNGSLDLAAGPDGSVVAAWTEYDGMLWLARSRDGGRSFSKPQHIAGNAKLPARGPSLAIGPASQVVLAWTVGEDPDADIRVSLSSDGGATFSKPALIGANVARADMARIAIDHGGALHLAYVEQGGKSLPAVRYARSAGPHARFGAPRTVSPGGAIGMDLAIDEWGRAHLVSEPASRRGLKHAYTTRTGFASQAVIPYGEHPAGGRNGSQQGALGRKLAVGPGGTIAVVNSILVPGSGSRVWVMRGRVAKGP